jgi:hypothetical protein
MGDIIDNRQWPWPKILRQALQNLMRGVKLSERFSPGGNVEDTDTNKFVYTCKDGWIDVGHYMMSALASYTLGERLAMQLGYRIENAQQYAAWLGSNGGWAQSAYTIEDLHSDALGVAVGQQMRNRTVFFHFVEGRTSLSALLMQPYDLAGAFKKQLMGANPVDPETPLDGVDARFYLSVMAADNATWQHKTTSPGFGSLHHCVCNGSTPRR